MPEIKTVPIPLLEGSELTMDNGNKVVSAPESVVFNKHHTLSDIIRYAISLSDYDEIKCLVELMKEEKEINFESGAKMSFESGDPIISIVDGKEQ